jgi:ribosomal subunit interface protein
MLKVMIKGINIELTDAITEAIEKKIGTLDKYLQHAGVPREAWVEVGKSTNHHKKGKVFRVVVDLVLPHKKLRAEADSFKLYDALDLAKDELKGEISKAVGAKWTSILKGARKAKEAGTETESL